MYTTRLSAPRYVHMLTTIFPMTVLGFIGAVGSNQQTARPFLPRPGLGHARTVPPHPLLTPLPFFFARSVVPTHGIALHPKKRKKRSTGTLCPPYATGPLPMRNWGFTWLKKRLSTSPSRSWTRTVTLWANLTQSRSSSIRTKKIIMSEVTRSTASRRAACGISYEVVVLYCRMSLPADYQLPCILSVVFMLECTAAYMSALV